MKDKRGQQLRDSLRALMLVHGTLEEARRPCGAPMSLPKSYALLELLHSDKPMTVSMLAEKLVIDRTNVSRLCARMEEAGELSKQVHPDDGRAWVLALTAAGKKLARSVDKSSVEHFEQLARKLGASTDRVIDSLKQLQRAMALNEEDK